MSKTDSRSRKRQDTSKSGGSRKSTKTRGSSSPRGNSSQTAPASFDQVFGKASSPEQRRLIGLLEASRERIANLLAQPVSKVRLYAVMARQKLRAEERHLARIQDALQSLDPPHRD